MVTNIKLHALSEQIIEELTTRELTIAIAESCTGGLATSYLTDIDGSSKVLPFSVVAYSVDAKEEFLGVPEYVIREFGTVSLECAKVMAEGLIDYDVDIGLATTGVIGESIEDKLKGTAFIAVAVGGMQTFGKDLVLEPKKSRHELKEEIVMNLFEVLLHAIETTY